MTIFNYTLNYIDLAFVLLLILAAVNCYHRGFVVNLLGFIKWSVGLFLCFFVSSYYAENVYDIFIRPRALDYINQKIVTSSNVDEILNNLTKMQSELPKPVAQLFDPSQVKLSSGDVAQSLLDNFFQPALMTLTKVALFVAVFIVFFLLMGIIILAVKHHNKKKDREGDSKLRTADKVLGLIVGLIKGAVFVFAVAAVLNYAAEVFDDMGKFSAFVDYTESSALLTIIKEMNPFNAVTEGVLI